MSQTDGEPELRSPTRSASQDSMSVISDDSPRILRNRDSLRAVDKLIFQEEITSKPGPDPLTDPSDVAKPSTPKRTAEIPRKVAPAPPPAPSARTPTVAWSTVRPSVFDKATKALYTEFKSAERVRNVAVREQAFVRLVEELFRLNVAPSLVLAHQNSETGLEFLCAWVIDPEETLQGWFTGHHLQEHAPEQLADYLTRLHTPDPRGVYRNSTRKASPVRMAQFTRSPLEDLSSV